MIHPLSLRNFGLIVSAALTFAQQSAIAGGPLQQICFSGSVPLQTTNWSTNVNLSKFDPDWGTLQQIHVTLAGEVRGTARAESSDPSPTQVTTDFQAQITLTRPDMSVIVITIPIANFVDNLSAFDGVVDFGGTSGFTHGNIVANDSDSVTSPPPASDLVLFSGPAGAPGTIALPVAAAGASQATGSGNLIVSFSTQASASAEVCYKYTNDAPNFPTCNANLMGSVGVPFSTQICVDDVDPADSVTLSLGAPLPAGATTVPALPITFQAGALPACITVHWTPDNSQVGTTSISVVATDDEGNSSTCKIDVLIAECHLLLGQAPVGGTGSLQVVLFGHLYDTQLSVLRRSWPVTMEDNPTVILPVGLRMSAQLLMYNPHMFPANPSQWSKLLTVLPNANGTLNRSWAGTQNGITLRATSQLVGGAVQIRFPFFIDGM